MQITHNIFSQSKIINKMFFCFIIIILLHPKLYANKRIVRPDLILNHKFEFYNLERKINIFEDKTGNISFKTILDKQSLLPFQKYIGNSINQHYSSSAFWLKCTISNKSHFQDWYLSLNNSNFDYVDMYVEENGSIFQHTRSGNFVHPDKRIIKYRYFAYPISINKDQIKTIFIRIMTSKLVFIIPTLESSKSFAKRNQDEYVLLGIYYGIMLVMILYNIFLLISTKDKNYFYYILYVTAFLIWQVAYNGIGDLYVWPDFPQFNRIAILILSPVVLITMLLFARVFLRIKYFSPRLNYFYNTLIIILIVEFLLLSIGFFNPVMGGIANFLNSVVMISVFSSAIFVFLKGYRPARFFIIGWTIFGIGMVSLNLFYFGLISFSFFSEYTIQIGSAIEVVLFSLALADRINLLKMEREDALEKYKALNSNLEIIVKQRTNELEKTLHTAHSDMHMAANVQRKFLPELPSDFSDWDVAFTYQPMSGVSGDFYDFYTSNEKFIGIGLFDVSGHGISSGLLSMIAKSIIFRNFVNGHDTELNTILNNANKELQKEIGIIENYYLTGLLLRFKNNMIEYANAGHPNIFIKSGNSVKEVLKEDGTRINGTFLGIEGLSESFDELSFEMTKGESLLLFTDCLSESKINGNEFGDEGIKNAFQNAPDGTADEILQYIMNEFNTFINDKKNIKDDLTVIVLRKK